MVVIDLKSHATPECLSRVRFRPGFTMMELMVAISILVIIILSVAVTFNGASKSVGMSQATMDMMANVRGIQQLMERDVSGMNKNCFLVIRSRLFNPNTSNVPGTNYTFADISPHYDQVSFISTGQFPNHGGAESSAISPFTDSTVANSAQVWWGQLIMERKNASPNTALPPYPSYVIPNQSAATSSQFPTGVYKTTSGQLIVSKESDFVLGRHTNLLLSGQLNGASQLPSGGQKIMAFPTLDGVTSPAVLITGNDGKQAHITSSRYNVVALTPSQVMQVAAAYDVSPLIPGSGPGVYERDHLTYRFRALNSVYDIEFAPANNFSPFANGYFRMTPIVSRGVSSFKVEWTDGRTFQNQDADTTAANLNQLRWYGAGGPNGLTKPYALSLPPLVLPVNTEQFQPGLGFLQNGDQYVAVFSYFNRPYWPKALRFTFHVASDRLAGGRDFVQVVKLPD